MQPKKSAETLMLPEDADQQPFCFSMISPTSIKGGAASQMSVEAMVRAPNSIAVQFGHGLGLKNQLAMAQNEDAKQLMEMSPDDLGAANRVLVVD